MLTEKRQKQKFGYTDDLMIMAETFRLWAIESDSQRVREILSFSQADEGVVITPDIEKFRELKLTVAEWYTYFQLRPWLFLPVLKR